MIQEQPFFWQISATTANGLEYRYGCPLTLDARLEIDISPLVESVRATTIEDCERVANEFNNPYIPPDDLPYGKGFIEGQNAAVKCIADSIRALKDNPPREE